MKKIVRCKIWRLGFTSSCVILKQHRLLLSEYAWHDSAACKQYQSCSSTGHGVTLVFHPLSLQLNCSNRDMLRAPFSNCHCFMFDDGAGSRKSMAMWASKTSCRHVHVIRRFVKPDAVHMTSGHQPSKSKPYIYCGKYEVCQSWFCNMQDCLYCQCCSQASLNC